MILRGERERGGQSVAPFSSQQSSRRWKSSSSGCWAPCARCSGTTSSARTSTARPFSEGCGRAATSTCWSWRDGGWRSRRSEASSSGCSPSPARCLRSAELHPLEGRRSGLGTRPPARRAAPSTRTCPSELPRRGGRALGRPRGERELVRGPRGGRDRAGRARAPDARRHQPRLSGRATRSRGTGPGRE